MYRRFAAMSVVVLLATMVFAEPGAPSSSAAPATSPAMARFAGKTVQLVYSIDVDGNGDFSDAEMDYLGEMLRRAGAKVSTSNKPAPLAAGDVLVLGTPVPGWAIISDSPDSFTDSLLRMQQGEFSKYERGRASWTAQAKASGATVLNATEAPAFFGFTGEDMEKEIRRHAFREAARALDQRFAKLQYEKTDFEEVIGFLRKEANIGIRAVGPSLGKLDVHYRAPVTIHAENQTLLAVLEEIGRQLGGDKAAVVIDSQGDILLVAKVDAEKWVARKPRMFLTPGEASHPPAELLAAIPAEQRPLYQVRRPVELKNAELSDVLTTLRDVSRTQFEGDWTSLKPLGITQTTRINVVMPHCRPLPQVLAEAANALAPDGQVVFYLRKDGVICLTTRKVAESATDSKGLVQR